MKTIFLLEKYKVEAIEGKFELRKVFYITFSKAEKAIEEMTSDVRFGNQFYYRVTELTIPEYK